MGKGLSQRRRLRNYNNAKQAKLGVIPLPPPPSELERKRKKHGREEPGLQGTASFRKMMAMKAIAESKQSPSARKGPKNSPQDQAGSKVAKDAVKQGRRQELPSATQPISSLIGSPGLNGQLLAEDQQPKQQAAAPPEADEGPFRKKTMKAKKKEFLKKRKLRKKGRPQEDELEERIMADDNRPVFGEQAMQPIKVNLKRKHWAGTAEEKAKNRIKDVFQRQMQKATAQATAKEREFQKVAIAESFKKVKRQQSGGGKHAAATPASLAALVKTRAEEAAAAAANQQ